MCVHLICSIREFRWFCCHTFNLSQCRCVGVTVLCNKWLPLLYIILEIFLPMMASNEHFHSQLNFNLFFFHMRKITEIDWMNQGGRRWETKTAADAFTKQKLGVRTRTCLITYIYIPIPDALPHERCVRFFWLIHFIYFPCSTKCSFVFFSLYSLWNICLYAIISWHICLVICKFFSE